MTKYLSRIKIQIQGQNIKPQAYTYFKKKAKPKVKRRFQITSDKTSDICNSFVMAYIYMNILYYIFAPILFL